MCVINDKGVLPSRRGIKGRRSGCQRDSHEHVMVLICGILGINTKKELTGLRW